MACNCELSNSFGEVIHDYRGDFDGIVFKIAVTVNYLRFWVS